MGLKALETGLRFHSSLVSLWTWHRLDPLCLFPIRSDCYLIHYWMKHYPISSTSLLLRLEANAVYASLEFQVELISYHQMWWVRSPFDTHSWWKSEAICRITAPFSQWKDSRQGHGWRDERLTCQWCIWCCHACSGPSALCMAACERPPVQTTFEHGC